MSTSLQTEVESFHCFLSKQIANGGRHKSPEELVQQWRREQEELAASAAEVREAIDDMNAGDRGRPLADVMRDICSKRGWAEDE